MSTHTNNFSSGMMGKSGILVISTNLLDQPVMLSVHEIKQQLVSCQQCVCPLQVQAPQLWREHLKKCIASVVKPKQPVQEKSIKILWSERLGKRLGKLLIRQLVIQKVAVLLKFKGLWMASQLSALPRMTSKGPFSKRLRLTSNLLTAPPFITLSLGSNKVIWLILELQQQLSMALMRFHRRWITPQPSSLKRLAKLDWLWPIERWRSQSHSRSSNSIGNVCKNQHYHRFHQSILVAIKPLQTQSFFPLSLLGNLPLLLALVVLQRNGVVVWWWFWRRLLELPLSPNSEPSYSYGSGF